MYWRDHPPVHISVAAVVNGLSGGPRSGRSAGPAAGVGEANAASAMESVAAILGPPQGKFRPPCRMLTQQPPAATTDG